MCSHNFQLIGFPSRQGENGLGNSLRMWIMKNLHLKAAIGSGLWRNDYWNPPRKFKGRCGAAGYAFGWWEKFIQVDDDKTETFVFTWMLVEVLVLQCRTMQDSLEHVQQQSIPSTECRARRWGKFTQTKWGTILFLPLCKTLISSLCRKEHNCLINQILSF